SRAPPRRAPRRARSAPRGRARRWGRCWRRGASSFWTSRAGEETAAEDDGDGGALLARAPPDDEEEAALGREPVEERLGVIERGDRHGPLGRRGLRVLGDARDAHARVERERSLARERVAAALRLDRQALAGEPEA